ncbi:hypothetical protein ACTFIU_001281 [Dictyostelium citrinum]
MNNDIVLVVNQIEQALSLLHDPKSNNKQREESQVFLEEIKARANAHSYAIAIITTSNNDILKHFALHIIETLVKNKWYESNDQERELIKKEILELMRRISSNEPKFIKEKLVTILVDVIKRDWPQRWMNLLTSLIEISKISDTQTELVLSTFGLLPHDIIFDSGSTSQVLSDQRRKDLMAGINLAVASLFEYFYQLLESKYTQYKQPSPNQPTTPQQTKQLIHLINVLLTTLRSYIEWVPSKVIFDHKLDQIFCQLILDVPFRMGACENLILFLGRKGRPDERIELIQTPFNYMENFLNAIKINSDFEDDYSFHKRITQALTILGTVHLNAYDDKHKIPNNYNIYLQLMLQMVSHPSILLSSFVLPFWHTFIKVESLELSYLEEVIKQIMETMLVKFVRIGDPEKSDSEQSKYSEIDFGTSKEWSNFFGGVRTRYLDIIKLITIQRREMAYIFIATKVADVLDALKANLNVASLSHEQTLLLESHSHILDSILLNIKDFTPESSLFFNKEQQKQQNIIQLTDRVLNLLFEISSMEPNITSFQIDCLQAYILYYQTNPESIKFLLNKIVPLIPFPGLENPNRAYQNSVLHTRRRAISSLIGISTNISHLMKPYFDILYTSVVELFQKNVVTETEKVMLFHLLIVFSNNLPSYQQTLDFYKGILTPIIEQWVSLEMSTALSSPDAFIQYLGLSIADGPNLDSTLVSRRKNIQYVVSTLQIFWKKSQIPTNSSDELFAPFISNGISYNGKWPISSFVKQVLPGVLSLTRTLHQLWMPEHRAKIHPSLSTIFNLDDSITAPLLGFEYHKEQKSESANVTFLRNLMDCLRDACYEIVGYGFSHSDELFSLPDLPLILLDSVFSYLESIENRHLKLLIKHILNYLIKNCPAKLEPTIYEPILPLLFSVLFNRIKAGWEIIKLRSQKGEKENEKNEIVEDKILRDVSMEFLMCSSNIINGQSPNYVFSSIDIMTPMVYGISSCLMANDTPILKKSLVVSTQLLDHEKLNDPKLFKLIGSEMFGCCIKILIVNKFAEFSNDFQSIIRLIYMKYYQICNYPQEILLSLPNITTSILQAFNNDLIATRSEKTQKVLFKKLLQDVIGIPLNKLKKESILDLPEKLFINKISDQSNENVSNISNLFN